MKIAIIVFIVVAVVCIWVYSMGATIDRGDRIADNWPKNKSTK